MIIDRIGVSQIQAQTQAKPAAPRPATRGTTLRFDAEPVEPIKPVKTPTRDTAARSNGGQAQRQDGSPQKTTDGEKNAAASPSKASAFSLDGQIPAEVKSPTPIEEQSLSGLSGSVLAQQFGGTSESFQGTFPPSGGRGLARQKGPGLYAFIQQATAAPSVQTRDNLDFWSDGIVEQRRTPINMYA